MTAGGLLHHLAAPVAAFLAALVIVHRHRLPLSTVAGAGAVPLTMPYGIGRLGRLLGGDGTWRTGEPSRTRRC